MALSSNELWQRIAAEGLASPMQCRSWAAEAAKTMPAADSTDGIKVLQNLIELGKLTNYQAKILAGQSDRPLRRGAWTILRRVKAPLWNGWLEVTKVDITKAEQPAASWVRWLTPDDLESLRSSAPSLPRGLQLAKVEHPHLQRVFVPELVDSELQLQVAPLEGPLLSDAFRAELPTKPQVTRLIGQLAEALSAMHAANQVHGRVLPDRIYWQDDQLTLARDPIAVLTATLDESAVGILGERLADLHVAQFLAPEFVAPGQLPTLASDVFAVGCTWWWLLTGKLPANGNSSQEILAAQTGPTPALPSDCDYPEPLQKCLQHCLAKNLDARFATASELVAALAEAARLIERGKSLPATPPVTQATATQAPVSQATVPQGVAAAVASRSTTSTPAKAAAPERAASASPTGAPAASPAAAEPAGEKPGQSKPTEPQPAGTQVAAQPSSKQQPARSQAPPPEPQAEPQKPAAQAPIEQVPAAKAPAKTSTAAKPALTPQPTLDAAAARSDAKPTAAAAEQTVAPTAQPVAAQATAPTAATAQPTAVTAPQNPATAGAAQPQTTEPTPSATLATPAAAEADTTDKPTAAVVAAASATTRRSAKRRKKGNKWLLPVVGGCGFLIILLLVLKLSGALEPSGSNNDGNQPKVAYSPPVVEPEVIQRDPRLDFFDIVDASNEQLWVPPTTPAPLQLNLLPPGGQLFVATRPATLLGSEKRRLLLAALDQPTAPLLQFVAERSGQALESIQQVTVAFYSAETSGGFPQVALRVELTQPKALSRLKADWGNPVASPAGEQELLVAEQQAYYVAEQPLVDAQSISEFSLGPVKLMQEVAELKGSSGFLTTQMETLHQRSDRAADVCVLLSPRYLFSEGRGLLEFAPDRLQQQLRQILSSNTRAALVQTRFEPDWYFESQIVGGSDRDAPALSAKLQDKISSLPGVVEAWFVDESPHPYWRGLALRFPQMLRTLADYSRFGVENGIAVMNAYLPADAAPNVVLGSWIALQDSATLAGDLAAIPGATPPTAAPPLTQEQYLARPIRLSFDQEPIEVALQLVGDEANDGLPAGTPQMRFLLDGDAFEKGGITRNQQLRAFNMDGKSVREALTEITKRGNPVTTVTDTRDVDQRLIWVVTEDPEAPGKQVISLTTRVAATAANIPLPTEFAPASE